MATDPRVEVQYATFSADVRLDAQSSPCRAVSRGEATRLYCGSIFGVLHLIVEDPGLRHPGTIPWSSVASVGWVTPPPIEWVTSGANLPAENVVTSKKPAAKAKPEAA